MGFCFSCPEPVHFNPTLLGPLPHAPLSRQLIVISRNAQENFWRYVIFFMLRAAVDDSHILATITAEQRSAIQPFFASLNSEIVISYLKAYQCRLYRKSLSSRTATMPPR